MHTLLPAQRRGFLVGGVAFVGQLCPGVPVRQGVPGGLALRHLRPADRSQRQHVALFVILLVEKRRLLNNRFRNETTGKGKKEFQVNTPIRYLLVSSS